jgi:hypothetical protein
MNPTARVVCFACLALALPVGALGIGLGAAGLNTLGGFALGVAGLMLVLTVALSLHDMSKAAKRDENDVELLRRMAIDGTFAEKAREAGIHIVLRKTT